MRSFFTWWRGQIAGLVPDIIKRVLTLPGNAAILEIGPEDCRLVLRSRGTIVQSVEAKADDAGMRELAGVMAGRNQKPPVLYLGLPAGRVLQKRLSLPVAARRDLDSLLGFEIDRETPFAADEVYWSYDVRAQDGAGDKIDVDLFVVPRNFADPLVRSARSAGLDPAAIAFEAGADRPVLIPLAHAKGTAAHGGRLPLIPLAASAAAIALVAIVAPFVYQGWAIASANAAIASLEPQAREALALRQSASQLERAAEFLKRERGGKGGVLGTLAAITRTLPDDTYLTSLSLRTGRLVMSGLSPSAAELVGVFAQTPEFREPAFDSPVVESENGELERFTISVALREAGQP